MYLKKITENKKIKKIREIVFEGRMSIIFSHE